MEAFDLSMDNILDASELELDSKNHQAETTETNNNDKRK